MLSIPHLVIIFLVALVVLGPEKLPQVARMMGKAMADFRRITTDFRVQIEDEMQEMERQARIKKEAAAAEATVATAITPAAGDSQPPGTIPREFSEYTPDEHAPVEPPAPVEHAAVEPTSEHDRTELAHPESDHVEKPADGDFHPA